MFTKRIHYNDKNQRREERSSGVLTYCPALNKYQFVS
jgi:hypothetical protein